MIIRLRGTVTQVQIKLYVNTSHFKILDFHLSHMSIDHA